MSESFWRAKMNPRAEWNERMDTRQPEHIGKMLSLLSLLPSHEEGELHGAHEGQIATSPPAT